MFCDGNIDLLPPPHDPAPAPSNSSVVDFATCDATGALDPHNALVFPDETLCYDAWAALFDVMDLAAVAGLVCGLLVLLECLRFRREACQEFRSHLHLLGRAFRCGRVRNGSSGDYDFSLFVNN